MWEWDDDGYPTEECLDEVKKWRGDDFREFFAALKPVWRYSEPNVWCGWHEENGVTEIHLTPLRRYLLSTGGWSGNELLIEAMESNYLLWGISWVQSRRGGHYIFEVPQYAWGENAPTAPAQ